MAALTVELIERRLQEHRAYQERLYEPEILLRAHGQRPLWKPPAKSAFEELAENLGIPETRWFESRDLREWARRHKDKYYVPEKLLRAWGFTVEVNL